jgi:hypothetical protein
MPRALAHVAVFDIRRVALKVANLVRYQTTAIA